MTTLELIKSKGGTVATITVNGITFYAAGYRSSGEVDVHDIKGDIVANATFHSDTESVVITIDGEANSQPSLYFEHDGKMEYDLAKDVGEYLAAIL